MICAMTTAVRKAAVTEAMTLAAMMARAFHDDPAMGWFFPDEGSRPRRLQKFFGDLTLRGQYGRLGEVYTTDDEAAVAVWAPPGKWRIGPADQLRILPGIVTALSIRLTPSRLRAFNYMESKHPRQPHWYLSILATDPPSQGKGLGSALLAEVLGRCDEEGLPAYLEASKEANVPFYRRHGFEVTEMITLPGGGPPLWPMWREPRPA
jgi:GNAT superfamily N-acetyltransferase